jgi:hypothetical protein
MPALASHRSIRKLIADPSLALEYTTAALASVGLIPPQQGSPGAGGVPAPAGGTPEGTAPPGATASEPSPDEVQRKVDDLYRQAETGEFERPAGLTGPAPAAPPTGAAPGTPAAAPGAAATAPGSPAAPATGTAAMTDTAGAAGATAAADGGPDGNGSGEQAPDGSPAPAPGAVVIPSSTRNAPAPYRPYADQAQLIGLLMARQREAVAGFGGRRAETAVRRAVAGETPVALVESQEALRAGKQRMQTKLAEARGRLAALTQPAPPPALLPPVSPDAPGAPAPAGAWPVAGAYAPEWQTGPLMVVPSDLYPADTYPSDPDGEHSPAGSPAGGPYLPAGQPEGRVEWAGGPEGAGAVPFPSLPALPLSYAMPYAMSVPGGPVVPFPGAPGASYPNLPVMAPAVSFANPPAGGYPPPGMYAAPLPHPMSHFPADAYPAAFFPPGAVPAGFVPAAYFPVEGHPAGGDGHSMAMYPVSLLPADPYPGEHFPFPVDGGSPVDGRPAAPAPGGDPSDPYAAGLYPEDLYPAGLNAVPAPEPGETPAPTANAAKVLAFARAQLGKPSVSGASGPSSYDCAGLTRAAWSTAGVELPRTIWGQVQAGTPVAVEQLLPGDLVFFRPDLSHVGIYMGDGLMVHAPEPGAGIREEPVHVLPLHSAVRPG